MIKRLIAEIQNVIYDSGIWEDRKKQEQLYKRLAQFALKNQAVLQFKRELGARMEFTNYKALETFRVMLDDKWYYIYFVLRNPTAKQKAVSISTDNYTRCKKNMIFIIFAIPQAADPNYYKDEIARATDEFSFYIASPNEDYDLSSWELGGNTYFILDKLEKFGSIKTKEERQKAINQFLR